MEDKEKNDILTKILNSIDEIKADVKSVKDDVKLVNKRLDIIDIKLNMLDDKLDDVIETNNLKLSREHKQWSFNNVDSPNNNN